MKMPFRCLAIVGLGALTACAASPGGGDRSLVSPSQPHAILSTALPPGPNYYRAQIIWLDGQYLSNQKRSSFWVAPGTHKIGFRTYINPNRGPSVMSSPATSQPQNMPTTTIDAKRGYTYYFGAKIPPGGNPQGLKVVVIKTTHSGG
jgi:hypothetical protein